MVFVKKKLKEFSAIILLILIVKYLINNTIQDNINDNVVDIDSSYNLLKKYIFPLNNTMENFLKTYFKLFAKTEKSKIKSFIDDNYLNLKSIFNNIYLIIIDNIFELLRPSTKLKIKYLIWLFFQSINKFQSDTLRKKKSCVLFYINFYCNSNLSKIFSNFLKDYIICLNETKNDYKNENIKIFENIFYDDLNYSLKNIDNLDLNVLFSEKETSIFNKSIESIRNYYKKYSRMETIKIIMKSINKKKNQNHEINIAFNIKSHVYSRKFIFRILKLTYYKNTDNYLINYKSNLIKLEKEIFDNYAKFNYYSSSNQDNFRDFKSFLSIKLYEKQQSVYNFLNDLISEINHKISLKKNINIKSDLIPFGSITQFLGSSNADLDLFLNFKINSDKGTFEKLNENDKLKITTKFLYNLYKKLRERTNNKISKVINHRLFTYTFEINDVKVDINYNNYFGIINSTLLRTYSLIDNRFLIICHFIKKLLQKLEIKNDEINKTFLNSYSWALILLTYMQNMENPILPKLLDYDRNQAKSQYFQEKGINKKMFENFFNFEKIENNTFLNDSIFNFRAKNITIANSVEGLIFKNKAKEFYKKNLKLKNNSLKFQIDSYLNSMNNYNFFELSYYFSNIEENKYIQTFLKNTKNEMSLSEIYINFLEFIIFYFDFEHNFISASYNCEGFYGKSLINKKNNEFSNDFVEFKNEFVYPKYLIGNFAILRDPFDYTYNPIKVNRDNFDIIKKKLKNHFFHILGNDYK